MWRKYYYFLYALCLIGLLSGTSYLRNVLTDLPSIYSLDDYTPSLITKLYDRKGRVITELYTERRTLIPLAQIPIDLQNAVLATEDESFFQHWGVSTRGILRAFIKNFIAGRVVQGGSTITQQLTKVLFLTHDRTIARKLKELFLAIQLEYNFTKEEILQMYLNQIYFGKGAYGVQSAAKLYFGKKTDELNLAECAMLAGLPRAPNYYSPFSNPMRAYRRRRVVLARMRRLGYITQDEEVAGNKHPLITKQQPDIPRAAPYFVEHVRRLLEPRYGSHAIYQGGLAIYTTLDLDIQEAADQAVDSYLQRFDRDKARALNALRETNPKLFPDPAFTPFVEISTHTLQAEGALVALDPPTGGIRAMVGGRDFGTSQFNRVTQAQRQPGSTFKPFVWTIALQQGLTPSTTIDDLPLAYYNDDRDWRLITGATDAFSIAAATATLEVADDQLWIPRSWDNKYWGPVTLRVGLEQSRNMVSIRLIDMFRLTLAHLMGIRSRLDPVLSLGLGTSVVTPLELTNAFETFANNGIHAEPYAIVRVEDHQGRVLEKHTPREKAVLEQNINFLMINLMKGVVERGTGRRARSLRRPAAGKTGTSQDYRDLWFVGFTPELVAGAWIGYDDFHPLGDHYARVGSVVPMWTDFMRRALAATPPRDFVVPNDIVFAKIDADTGRLALQSCPHVILEAYIRGTEPVDFCEADHALPAAPPAAGSDSAAEAATEPDPAHATEPEE